MRNVDISIVSMWFDDIEKTILSIDDDDTIEITSCGKTIRYDIIQDDDYTLQSDDDDYGLSCVSLKELIYRLLIDYETGKIDNLIII